MKNKLTEQLDTLEKSVQEAKNASFNKKMAAAEKTVDESLQLCRLLVAENITLNQRIEALEND